MKASREAMKQARLVKVYERRNANASSINLPDQGEEEEKVTDDSKTSEPEKKAQPSSSRSPDETVHKATIDKTGLKWPKSDHQREWDRGKSSSCTYEFSI